MVQFSNKLQFSTAVMPDWLLSSDLLVVEHPNRRVRLYCTVADKPVGGGGGGVFPPVVANW